MRKENQVIGIRTRKTEGIPTWGMYRNDILNIFIRKQRLAVIFFLYISRDKIRTN